MNFIIFDLELLRDDASPVSQSLLLNDPPNVTAAEYGGGNDDILWAALGWMKYYQFWAAGGGTGKNLAFLLSSAKGFIDTVAATIPSQPCPGGVLWKPSGGTITNALFIHASAMYFIITGTTSYLTQASLYTYNTGQMLGAAGALYTATGNKTYLAAGNATLNSLVTRTDFNRNGILFENTCDASACTGNDNAWSFKGITMEGVQYFLDAANDPTITSLYSPWIGFQVASINKNAVPTSGDVGNVWYQQGTQVRNSATLGMAISAENAAVKYGANNGTFTC
ncbi:hypothetical protein FB451DRAFT_1408839 [Mycena latifolia]|nr:hypothetical protein FB451DRAFT_1408839 [Mycena latifolia]